MYGKHIIEHVLFESTILAKAVDRDEITTMLQRQPNEAFSIQ